MNKESNRQMILGERRWWPGVLFLIAVVYIFTRQFLPGFDEIVEDPFYFFLVVMVGLTIAAPALWILNEGRRFFFDRGGENDVTQSDLFKNLMSLPEGFRTFQGIVIDKHTFDAIVVGKRSLSVIGVLTDKSVNVKGREKILVKETKKKTEFLKGYFGSSVKINYYIVRKNKANVDGGTSTKNMIDKGIVMDPSSLRRELEESDSNGRFQLSSEVVDKLDRIWRGEG